MNKIFDKEFILKSAFSILLTWIITAIIISVYWETPTIKPNKTQLTDQTNTKQRASWWNTQLTQDLWNSVVDKVSEIYTTQQDQVLIWTGIAPSPSAIKVASSKVYVDWDVCTSAWKCLNYSPNKLTFKIWSAGDSDRYCKIVDVKDLCYDEDGCHIEVTTMNDKSYSNIGLNELYVKWDSVFWYGYWRLEARWSWWWNPAVNLWKYKYDSNGNATLNTNNDYFIGDTTTSFMITNFYNMACTKLDTDLAKLDNEQWDMELPVQWEKIMWNNFNLNFSNNPNQEVSVTIID